MSKGIRTTLAALIALVAVEPAVALEEAIWRQLNSINKGTGARVSPFGEKGVYQLDNVFAHQSTWGLTNRRDVQSTTNSGTIDIEDGFISLETGTTTGSTAKVETVEYGRYEPGRGAEAGVGVFPTTIPAGTGVEVKFGAYTDDDGAYWRIKDSDSDGSNDLCVVYENAGTENETCGIDNFNGENQPSDFDPISDAWVAVLRLNWYGVGGTEYTAYYADDSKNGTLGQWVMHRFAPDTGQSFRDPNLPVTAEVDNGSTTSNVEIQLGGRRYDVQGRIAGEVRRSGEFRGSQSVAAADGLVPLICARRESDFPTAGRTNTVGMFVQGWDLETDADIAVYIVVDANVSGGNFSTPTHHIDTETAVELNAGVTDITSPDAVTGPWFVGTGQQGNASGLGSNENFRIQFPQMDPVCLAADVVGGTDASVSSAMRIVETW